MQYLESALRHGSPFEAFHLYASIHASIARRPVEEGGKPGFCGAAVAWYKLVSERGSWSRDLHDDMKMGDNYVLEAEKAWARGEESQAMVGWFVAAEMGNEAAQNNLGWLLEKGIGKDVLYPPPRADGTGGVGSRLEAKAKVNEMAMRWWIRSAAQDNVDSMVKVGDYYCGSHPSILSLHPSTYSRHGRSIQSDSIIRHPQIRIVANLIRCRCPNRRPDTNARIPHIGSGILSNSCRYLFVSDGILEPRLDV